MLETRARCSRTRRAETLGISGLGDRPLPDRKKGRGPRQVVMNVYKRDLFIVLGFLITSVYGTL